MRPKETEKEAYQQLLALMKHPAFGRCWLSVEVNLGRVDPSRKLSVLWSVTTVEGFPVEFAAVNEETLLTHGET